MKLPPAITSIQNRRIKETVSLHTRKGRMRRGVFIAEGRRVIEEAIAAGIEPARVLFIEEMLDSPDDARIIEALVARGAEPVPVTRQVMKAASGTEKPAGLLAELARPAPPADPVGTTRGGASVLACRIQDPRNLGLLARTVAAAGARVMMVSRRSADPFHPAAVRSSAGALFHLPTACEIRIGEAISAAREAGIETVATAVDGGVPAGEWLSRAPESFILLVGNEGAGLDSSAADAADTKISIPMWGRVESLNVAVSAGIVLYMWRMARGDSGPGG